MTKLHTVVETPTYLSDAKACQVDERERAQIVDEVATAPDAGDVIQNTGGVRKMRVAGRGKKKSGGYRLIALFIGDKAPVYLLAMLSKGERANFSAAEKKLFRKLRNAIKAEWKGKRNGKTKS